MSVSTHTQNVVEPLPAVRCMAWLGESVAVPESLAKCPECGYTIEAVVDGWSEGSGYSISVNCGMDDFTEDWHRYWQGEWQPVLDVVKAWANSPSEKVSYREPGAAADQHNRHGDQK